MSGQITGEYAQLVDDLKKIIVGAQQQMAQASKRIMVQAYWEIGKRIIDVGFPEGALTDLAKDLGVDRTRLSRCMMLYQQWPKGLFSNDDAILSWGHYRVLMTEKNEHRRRELEEMAREEGWNRDELQRRVKDKKLTKKVSSSKSKGEVKPTESSFFIYAAKVVDVIDADTIALMIDVGFNMWREDNIRLRGINAPEIDSPEGQRARDFVVKELQGLERIVVKTSNQRDYYKRYLGDIYYKKGETDRDAILNAGVYLNNQLVQKGLADLY